LSKITLVQNSKKYFNATAQRRNENQNSNEFKPLVPDQNHCHHPETGTLKIRFRISLPLPQTLGSGEDLESNWFPLRLCAFGLKKYNLVVAFWTAVMKNADLEWAGKPARCKTAFRNRR
jgi:hypothetical protein